jgi:hypothetical protein
MLFLAVALPAAGCKDLGTDPPPSSSPPPTHVQGTVSFQQDIKPIFADPKIGCLGCHGGTNGLFLGTQPDLLRGGASGPAVIPGNSAQSLLIRKLLGTAPGAQMPLGGNAVPDSLIQRIRTWIDQGALNN